MTNTVIIGVAGAGRRAGCTHLCLVLANFLKNRNYRVALFEKNNTGVFENIADSEDIAINTEGSFLLNNVDCYTQMKETTQALIMSRPYDYLIIDYGDYLECDKVQFSTSTKKIITCGSKAWEFGGINALFEHTHEEILKSFYYCFIFASQNKALQREIIDGMEALTNIFFTPYTEDPFTDDNFADAHEILGIESTSVEVSNKKNPLKLQRKKKVPKEPVYEAKRVVEEVEEFDAIEDFEVEEFEGIDKEIDKEIDKKQPQESREGFLSRIASVRKQRPPKEEEIDVHIPPHFGLEEEVELEKSRIIQYDKYPDSFYLSREINTSAENVANDVLLLREIGDLSIRKHYAKAYEYAIAVCFKSGSDLRRVNDKYMLSIDGRPLALEVDALKEIVPTHLLDLLEDEEKPKRKVVI